MLDSTQLNAAKYNERKNLTEKVIMNFFNWINRFYRNCTILAFCFIATVSAFSETVTSDQVFASIYTTTSHTIVLEARYSMSSNDSAQMLANKTASNYVLSNSGGVGVKSVTNDGSTKLVLELDGNLSFGTEVSLEYRKIYLKQAESDLECTSRVGSLCFRVSYIPERPSVVGVPLTWGEDANGKLDTEGLENIVAVAAGKDFTIYLKSDGSVVNKGSTDFDGVSDWSDVVAIDAYETVAAGLKADGTVYVNGVTGSDIDSGKVKNWTNIVQVTVNETGVVGLKKDGSIAQTENIAEGTVINWTNLCYVTLSERYIAGLSASGELKYFDLNGETGGGETIVSNVRLFDTGRIHIVYVKEDGSISGVDNTSGWNLLDSTGIDGTKVDAVSAGNSHNLYLVDGEVVIKGVDNQAWTTLPSALSGTHDPVIAVATGRRHSVALLEVPGQSGEEAITETIQEGEKWNYTMSLSDWADKDLLYTMQSASLPEGMIFNTTDGAFYWQTDENDGPGTYEISVLVSDANDGTEYVTQNITLVVNEVNTAPWVAVGDVSATAGLDLDLGISAGDVDVPANTLSFSLTQAPSDMSIEASTGRIQWTPTSEDVGTHTVTVAVSDGVATTSASFVVTVSAAEEELAIVSIPNVIIPELSAWRTTLSATGGDTDTGYTWTLISYPSGMTLTGNVLQWTPSESQDNTKAAVAPYFVLVQVTDGTDTVQETFYITVTEVNSSPVIQSISDQTLKVGDTLSLSLASYSSDADLPANTLAYSLVSGAPSEMQLDPATGLITCKLIKSSYRETPYKIFFEVSDGLGGVTQSSFTLGTVYVNNAPVIVGAGSSITIPELSEANLTTLLEWTFNDTDNANESLIFSLLNAPDGMTVDESGNITWTPTELQGPGEYSVTLQVNDADSLEVQTAERVFTVIVTEVNSAPVFPTVSDLEATVGSTFSFTTLRATDSDNPVQKIKYSLSGDAPSGLVLYSNGDIVWTPTSSQIGSHTITIVATDDGTPEASASVDVTIVVQASENAELVFLPIGTLTIKEHAFYQHTLAAYSTGTPAAGTIQYSLLESSAGMSMSESGVFTWIPGESDGGKTYTVTVKALETGEPNRTASMSFQIVVEEVNNAPVITPISTQTVSEENLLEVIVSASDPEDDTLTYKVVSITGPQDVESADAIFNGNVFQWRTREKHGPGAYIVTLRVSDPSGASADTSFRVLVKAVNTPPVFTMTTTTFTAYQGKTFTATLTATDADIPTEQLIFSKKDGPDELIIHPHSGEVSWDVPLEHAIGNTTFEVQVSDVNAGLATQVITVNVKSWSETVGAQGSIVRLTSTLEEGEQFEFALQPYMAANRNWQFISAPNGMTYDSALGCINWIPSELDGGGVYEVILNASKGSAQQSPTDSSELIPDQIIITLEITEVNSPVQMIIPAIPSIRLNQEIRFVVQVSDEDIPQQTLSLALTSDLPTGASFNAETGEFVWRSISKTAFDAADHCILHFCASDSGEQATAIEEEVCLSLLSTSNEPLVQYEYEQNDLVEMNWSLDTGKQFCIYGIGSDPVDTWQPLCKIQTTDNEIILEESLDVVAKSGWFRMVSTTDGQLLPIQAWNRGKDNLLHLSWDTSDQNTVSEVQKTSDLRNPEWNTYIQVNRGAKSISFQPQKNTENNLRSFRVEEVQ